MNRQKVHFINPALISPNNPISVNVIGAGGTGSHLLEVLGRIHLVLTETRRAGLQVNLFDPDQIEVPNLGRASFNENYLGMNKAVAVIDHINRKFGTHWKAISKDFVPSSMIRMERNRIANLTFSCVDTVKSRLGIADVLKYFSHAKDVMYSRDRPHYLFDFGNSQKTGQVILSTLTDIQQPESDFFDTVTALPSMTDEFAEHLGMADDSNDEPSCSIMDALSKQSLFINSILAHHAGALLDEMLNDGAIGIRGFFINLETHRVEPIRL